MNLIMHGHGHVLPRLDGAVARCGGPTICSQCAREKAQWDDEKKAFVEQVTSRSDLKRRNVQAGRDMDEGVYLKPLFSEGDFGGLAREFWFPEVLQIANAKAAALAEEIEKWRQLIGVVEEIGGTKLNDKNYPLAIAASYSLLHSKNERLNASLKEAEKVIRNAAEKWTFVDDARAYFERAKKDLEKQGGNECSGK